MQPKFTEETAPVCDTILVDFDGPLFVLFSSAIATRAADELRRLALDFGLDPSLLDADPDDFFDVWRKAAATLPHTEREAYAIAAEQIIERIETYAASIGPIEEPRIRFLRVLRTLCRTLGVVTNNHTDVVRSLIERMQCSELVDYVAGRSAANIEHLKPSPALLREAMTSLSSRRESTVFIGDSPTDAAAAGAAQIGYLAFAERGNTSRGVVHLGMSRPQLAVAVTTAVSD